MFNSQELEDPGDAQPGEAQKVSCRLKHLDPVWFTLSQLGQARRDSIGAGRHVWFRVSGFGV